MKKGLVKNGNTSCIFELNFASKGMKIKELINELNKLAPGSYQESYDNSRLITGDSNLDCTGVLICLDSIEEIVDEAIEKNCNLIVAHHPIIFSGLKSLTGKNYIERVVIKCIKNDIVLFAIHTNLDNVKNGVNHEIATRIGLKNTRILAPKPKQLKKLVFYVPENKEELVKDAIFKAGAGQIGEYNSCSFQTKGEGQFQPLDKANPFLGQKNKLEKVSEYKVECVFASYLQHAIINALKQAHPYEEVAYEVYELVNTNEHIGSGMVGELEEEIDFTDFVNQLKETFRVPMIRGTKPIRDKVKTVALCGGSGSFLLGNSIGAKADVFITGDFKYHQFFDAENAISILDIGHFESEQYTIQLIKRYLKEKFPNFALFETEVNTNPIKYY